MNLVSFEKDPNFLGGWLLEAIIFGFISCNYDCQKNIVVVVMEYLCQRFGKISN